MTDKEIKQRINSIEMEISILKCKDRLTDEDREQIRESEHTLFMLKNELKELYGL